MKVELSNAEGDFSTLISRTSPPQCSQIVTFSSIPAMHRSPHIPASLEIFFLVIVILFSCLLIATALETCISIIIFDILFVILIYIINTFSPRTLAGVKKTSAHTHQNGSLSRTINYELKLQQYGQPPIIKSKDATIND